MNGLILAGGNSTRMGEDKAAMNYHGKPQYLYLKEIMEDYCDEIFLSSTKEEFNEIASIIDCEYCKNHGPYSGILSAFEYKKTDWLVLAIDYPLIDSYDIEFLIQSSHLYAAGFYNSLTDYYEPTLAIYREDSYPVLKQNFQNGSYSLQQFLNQIQAEKIIPTDLNKIKSIDTKNEKDWVMGLLDKSTT